MLVGAVNTNINTYKNSQIAFGRGTKYIDSKKIGKENFWNEAKFSEQARKNAGVNAPMIGHCRRHGEEMCAEYKIDGERFDAEFNPIEERHLESIFNNFFALDKAGILHGDLGLGHIYFSDNENGGKLEIDGFKTATSFSYSNGAFYTKGLDENKSMPSNAKDFEEDGLCEYIYSIDSEKEQFEFLKKYLHAKSKYHANRADYLCARGLDINSKAVQEELVKAEALSKPSARVLRNKLDELNLYARGAHAFYLWKDGYGLTDGINKPNQRINSILTLFDCLKYGLQLRDDTDTATNAPCLHDHRADAKYFALEKEEIDIFNEKLLECIKGAGKKTFTKKTFERHFNTADKKPELNMKDEAEKFVRLCSKIDTKLPYEDTKKAIYDAERRYGGLAFSDSPDSIENIQYA